MILRTPILCLLLLCCGGVRAQSSAETDRKVAEQERVIRSIEREIAEEDKRISGIKTDKANARQRARLITRQIERRNDLLAAEERKERILVEEMRRKERSARALQTELSRRREQYAEMVREAWRNYRSNSVLTYIFSSKDFNDAARRIGTLRAVSSLRERQIRMIDSLGLRLDGERAALARRQRQVDSVQSSLSEQKRRLERDRAAAAADVKKLSGREQAALKKRLEQERRLNVAIAELRKLVKGNKEGSSFGRATSNLNLPVRGGAVKRYIDNLAEVNGPRGAQVLSIYDGKVVDVKRDKITNAYVIFIAHGEYITSYAYLSASAVEKGMSVKRNQVIGTVGSRVVDPLTMKTEYGILFGIYSPDPREVMRASECFTKR